MLSNKPCFPEFMAALLTVKLMLETIIEGGFGLLKEPRQSDGRSRSCNGKGRSEIASGNLEPAYSLSGKMAQAIVEYQIWKNKPKDTRLPLEQMAGQLFSTIPRRCCQTGNVLR